MLKFSVCIQLNLFVRWIWIFSVKFNVLIIFIRIPVFISYTTDCKSSDKIPCFQGNDYFSIEYIFYTSLKTLSQHYLMILWINLSILTKLLYKESFYSRLLRLSMFILTTVERNKQELHKKIQNNIFVI